MAEGNHIPIAINEGDFVKRKSFHSVNAQVKTEQVIVFQSKASFCNLLEYSEKPKLHVMELTSLLLLKYNVKATL